MSHRTEERIADQVLRLGFILDLSRRRTHTAREAIRLAHHEWVKLERTLVTDPATQTCGFHALPHTTRLVMADAHASHLARALDHLQARNIGDLASLQDRAVAMTYDLGHALVLARRYALGRHRGFQGAVDTIRGAHIYAFEVADCLHRATALSTALAVPPGQSDRPGHPADAATPHPAVQPTQLAAGLVDAAARALPPEHRARYREEFGGELHDLAEAGAARYQQIRYALRLFDRAWQLRAELRVPARRSAAP